MSASTFLFWVIFDLKKKIKISDIYVIITVFLLLDIQNLIYTSV